MQAYREHVLIGWKAYATRALPFSIYLWGYCHGMLYAYLASLGKPHQVARYLVLSNAGSTTPPCS